MLHFNSIQGSGVDICRKKKKTLIDYFFSTLLNTSMHFNLGQRVENGIWLIRGSWIILEYNLTVLKIKRKIVCLP